MLNVLNVVVKVVNIFQSICEYRFDLLFEKCLYELVAAFNWLQLPVHVTKATSILIFKRRLCGHQAKELCNTVSDESIFVMKPALTE